MNTVHESQIGPIENAARATASIGSYVWRAALLAAILLAVAWRAHHDPQTEAERQARLQVNACWHDLNAASQALQAPTTDQCLRLEHAYAARYAR